MSAGTMLRPVLWLTLPPVWAATRALWSAPRLRDRYPAYLAIMHGLVRASVPLMQAAADRCAVNADDGAGLKLAEYFRAHADEEAGHDEWLLEDLAVLGLRHPDALLRPSIREDIAALVGAQYYWVRHLHPACLLGYMAVLEGCPPDAGLVSQLPGRTGWPPAAFRTLAIHAAADPGHLADLIEVADLLPLSATVIEGVARNAASTAARAARLLLDVVGDDRGGQP